MAKGAESSEIAVERKREKIRKEGEKGGRRELQGVKRGYHA